MTQLTSQILNQALQLPVEERELLAVELMIHLHPENDSIAGVDAAWHAEIERRAAESDSSNDSIPFEEAWTRIVVGKNGSGTLPANG
jgi:hypothetical protein